MGKKVTVELFSGTGSFSKVALEYGLEINTYDIDKNADEIPSRGYAPSREATHTRCDVLDTEVKYPQNPYMAWFSPPCQAFSIAAARWHFDRETGLPKSETGIMGMALLNRTLDLILELKPKYWIIENPMGQMRKKIPSLFSERGIGYINHLITYCQYEGDASEKPRMKPTDLFTNIPPEVWTPRPRCFNGDSCHQSAPRGSKTGTQGLKNARERSVVPSGLFHEIFTSVLNQPLTYEALLADIGNPFEGLMPDDRW